MTNGVLDGYETPEDVAVLLGTDRATGQQVRLSLSMLTRHGYIGGATGSGKTRTVQQMVEWCSSQGVPCVVPDPKRDLSGMALPGKLEGRAMERAEMTGQSEWWEPIPLPVQFLALGGNGIGVPVRATVSTFPAHSLMKLINLLPAQQLALKATLLDAQQSQVELETIDDLREFVRNLRDNPDSSISPAVCNRLMDKLRVFEAETSGLFGGPEFDVFDLMRQDDDGWGMVSVIDCASLADTPEVQTTFMLWLLDRLCKQLPEVGEVDKPKLLFFLDEVHLMFQDAHKEFVREVLKVVKRIRSKGVGIVFISQSSADIPSPILEQCANRIQHVLRAVTPQHLRDIRKTVETFPLSKRYEIGEELTSMGTGEALVSVITDDGHYAEPAVVLMYVPKSSMSPMQDDDEMWNFVKSGDLWKKYREMERDWREEKREKYEPPVPEVRTRAEPDNSATGVMGALMTRLRERRGTGTPEDAAKPAATRTERPADDPWDT